MHVFYDLPHASIVILFVAIKGLLKFSVVYRSVHGSIVSSMQDKVPPTSSALFDVQPE